MHGALSWGPGMNPEVGPEESAGPTVVKVQGVEAGKVCAVVPGREGGRCVQGTSSNVPSLGQEATRNA